MPNEALIVVDMQNDFCEGGALAVAGALATVPLRDAGAASGTYGTFQQIGAAVGVAISATVFFAAVGTDFSQPNVMGALLASGGIAASGYLLAALSSLMLPKRADVQRHLAELAAAAEADEEVLART